MSDELNPQTADVAEVLPKKKLKDMNEEELREYRRVKTKKGRDRVKQQRSAIAGRSNSTIEITTKNAVEILLSERGLQNEHVAEVCVELAAVAATHHKLSFNAHLFVHGLRHKITGEPAVEPSNVVEEVDAEILHRADLYALWDYGFWRQPDISFEQWLVARKQLKSSAFELSKILGKEDFGSTHEEWDQFLPRWNPEGLHPGYTQREALTWLGNQVSDTEGDRKRFLLVASRNSMKSTFIRVHALCLTICCPDASILLVSETNKLSKKGMKEFKGYLETSWKNPTLFQQTFAEYCISQDDGEKLIYVNPLARLGLPQNACESSSMESANTGSRFWYCIFDDPISRDNGTSNDEQRAAALAKYGSITKLREPAGRVVSVQTPWCPNDLGDVMIQQNSVDPEHPLAVRIDPVMEIKKEAVKKPLLELTEQDVTLNFLPKLNWRFVRDEMRSPEGLNFFRTQYMCEWVAEGDELRLQFDHDELYSRVRPLPFYTTSSLNTSTWICCEKAHSTSRHADLTAIVVGRIQPVQGKQALVIVDLKMDRMRDSEVIKASFEMIQKWNPTVFISEADKGMASAQDMGNAIRNMCLSHQVVSPYFRWLTASNTPRAKFKKFKALEQPLSDGRLHFVSSSWTEQLLNQFERFTGLFKNSGTSIGGKDDGVDGVSILWQEAKSLHIKEERPAEDIEEQRRAEELEASRELRRMHHAAMFGGQNRYQEIKKQPPLPPPPPGPPDPKEAARKGMLSILPKGFRL